MFKSCSDDDNGMADSGSEKDGSEFDDDEFVSNDLTVSKALTMIRYAQSNLLYTTLLAFDYYLTYCDKNEHRIDGQSGYGWMLDVLKNPGSSHKMFRMDATLFYSLHDLLVTS